MRMDNLHIWVDAKDKIHFLCKAKDKWFGGKYCTEHNPFSYSNFPPNMTIRSVLAENLPAYIADKCENMFYAFGIEESLIQAIKNLLERYRIGALSYYHTITGSTRGPLDLGYVYAPCIPPFVYSDTTNPI